nr:double-stranded RNA-binding [Tanacetum cinerariifolium]
MKSPPVYQTRNEGLAHIPKYRSTVFFDGATYNSSNTFQQLKMAEEDVSRIAYIATRQKSKTEALNLIREDKMFCKSIMADYAVKINVEIPTYKTTRLAGLIPVFRSSVLFNGVNYQGDDCKSKKEAEQLVARAVILSCLDSESGNDIVDIINCKLRPLVELNKVQEISNVHQGTNVMVPLTEAQIAATTPALPHVTQPCVPVSVQDFSTAISVATQPCIPGGSTAVTVATQAPISKVSVEAISPTVPEVTQAGNQEVFIQEVPATVAEAISPTVPEVTQAGNQEIFIQEVPAAAAVAVTVATQSSISDVSVEAITPAAPVATLPRTPKVAPEVSVEAMNVVPVTQPKIPKVEEYSEYPPVNETSERKRSRSSRRKANKKMRLEAQ